MRYTGKHNTKEAYERIVISSSANGDILRLKDVAEVEFDSLDYDVLSKENGRPSAAILLKQRPGSNAKEVIDNIKKATEEIKASSFPPGMDYTLSYDVSEFLDASIHEVIKTLVEAFVLVALVVFIFFAGFPLNPDTHHCRAGIADRHVFLYAVDGVFAQPDHIICLGACHRHRRR